MKLMIPESNNNCPDAAESNGTDLSYVAYAIGDRAHSVLH